VTATGPVRAYVGLGANLGAARDAVERALAQLALLPATTLVARSSLFRTAPVDADGPEYVNAVAALDTGLSAPALLAHLHALEAAHGRLRPYLNAPRTLDLDLLLWGDMRSDVPALRLPHPRMHLRGFVLEPLAELAPELQIPGRGPLSKWRALSAGQDVQRMPD
jgi:2-amino-4-hydroxy-6-hydroxymethyldihydropteridine diphosphokinase